MECIIPGNNMKVLGKALQALSKIGDELYIEANEETLSFITLNSSKTVCARFNFLNSFFSHFEVNPGGEAKVVTCKVHMKIFLPLFKGNVEKKVDYFKIDYEACDSDFIIFKMKYKCDDMLMVHKLRLMDNESLTIGVQTNSGTNNMTASSVFYNQLLAMLSTSDDEITFEITSNKVVARNYCIGTPCRPKMMRSQINLNPSEFLYFKVTKDTTLNFSLKPFRTLIHFAENFLLNIDFNFDIGGKPLSMILKNPTFEVCFMVATLNPYNDGNTSLSDGSHSIVCKGKPQEVTHEDFEAMQVENWEEDDISTSIPSPPPAPQEKNKENIDVIPRSPESPRTKRAKTVFSRCYDPTFHETVLGEVLAGNSDSE